MTTRTISKQWTKQDMLTIKQLWETKTGRQICDELACSPQQLGYIVKQIRLAGFELPKKHKVGTLRELILETFK